MHSLLDTYLKEVAGHLAGLPTARRAEELREVRTHLENAVVVNQEMGQSEDEAARTALEQFGTPSELADSLDWAWRREERNRKQRSDWWVAGATVLLGVLGVVVYPHGAALIGLMGGWVLLIVGWRLLPPMWVPKWVSYRFGPMSACQRWAYGAAILGLCALTSLHPFYVPHVLWTDILTRGLNISLALGILYLRYRAQKTAQVR